MDTPRLVECKRLLNQLLLLIAEGRGDSVEAEALRDSADPLWAELDAAERAAIQDAAVQFWARRDA
jgi:hypothetical protein